MVKVGFFRETLEIPEGVKVEVKKYNHMVVSGPNGGPIEKDFSHARGVTILIEGNEIIFKTNFPRSSTLALIKTIMSLINNLITGVQTPYKYICKVCYSHFPCNVEIKKDEIHVVNFLGEKAPRKSRIMDNVKVKVEGEDVILEGPDKEALGQTAANIKSSCRIRKKDPRVFSDGVYLYKTQVGEEITWEIK